jgi:acyl-[acyl-carrier protein] desaturase
VTDEQLLVDLAPAAESLFSRHLAAARPWYPHQLVPWERVTDAEPLDDLADGVRGALIVNLLTEDNLPAYAIALHHHFGRRSPWAEWVRRWTAEEMRHATVIRDYLTVTRAVDLEALEDARLRHVATSPGPAAPNVLEALVYVALQELATRVAHGNTGRALADPAGQAIMRRVAADETLHHLFYRDIVSAALERHPDATVLAIDAQARHFTMPGLDMPELHEHAPAIADAGIYSMAILQRQVLAPVLLGHWRLDRLDGLSQHAETARRRTLRFLERLGRFVDRLPAPSARSAGHAVSDAPVTDAPPAGVPGRSGSS